MCYSESQNSFLFIYFIVKDVEFSNIVPDDCVTRKKELTKQSKGLEQMLNFATKLAISTNVFRRGAGIVGHLPPSLDHAKPAL